MEVVIDYSKKELSIGIRDFWKTIPLRRVLADTIDFYDNKIEVRFDLSEDDVNDPYLSLRYFEGGKVAITSLSKIGDPYNLFSGAPIQSKLEKDLLSSARLEIIRLEAIGAPETVNKAKGWKECMKHFNLDK